MTLAIGKNTTLDSKQNKILIFSFSVIFSSIFIGYLLLKAVPTIQAEGVAEQFEIAVRKDDKGLIEEILSPENKYWENAKTPKLYPHLQNLFGKFHKGVEVYQCSYFPSFLSRSEKAQIFAFAKMKAKKDNKYRKHFQIELVKSGGEWKLVSFYFPDFVDY